MEKRSNRSILLIGVFIGIYGNWLVAVFQEIAKEFDLSSLLTTLSLFPLFYYFWKIHKEDVNPQDKNWKRLLWGSHFILILVAYIINNEVFNLNLPFIVFGLAIWFFLYQVEWRAFDN